MHPFVYLASQSPRRRQLLEQIGVAYELLLPDADEDAESLEAAQPGEDPATYVQRVTQAKADAAVRRWQARQQCPLLRPAPILCADTTVALHGQILGKPTDAAEAADMLRRLSGQRHEVLTALVLHDPSSGHRQSACSVSEVWFDALDEACIAAYIATGEPFGKAGAYGIQGAAALLVRRMAGSFSGIVGLPLFELGQMLRAGAGASAGEQAAKTGK
ncbi:MAG: Maf family protein [Brachymonas sp.]|nr:Maf family protein [Brachymonas sp.]